MAFHVPFNQRNPGQQQLPGPIYIGFDIHPPRPRRKFNWWGFNGMWMSLASLFSAGILSPISLVVSLIGLRRPGKRMAMVGTLVSLLGTGIASLIAMGAYHSHQDHQARRSAKERAVVVKKQVDETTKLVALATAELQEYQADNEGEFPNDIDANMLVIKYVDPWGVALRFEQEHDKAIIRSAGPDSKFYTKDDVTQELTCKTESKLVPVKPSND